jgi:hypothetical protein
MLDIVYEGDDKEGNIELQDKAGSVLRFSWVPVSRLGKESIKEHLERVSKGEELVASGDVPGGAWSDVKRIDPKDNGRHVVQSVVKTKKHLVNCHYAVPEAQVEQARGVCKSVREY